MHLCKKLYKLTLTFNRFNHVKKAMLLKKKCFNQQTWARTEISLTFGPICAIQEAPLLMHHTMTRKGLGTVTTNLGVTTLLHRRLHRLLISMV
jgi:lysophospholipid acyltransferase (LPLAT)-like uncharacterized protein